LEDDSLLGKAVRTGLEQQGNAVDWVQDGATAELALFTNDYAALVLDIGLPKLDGMTLLKKLRAKGNRLPVVIITARDEVADRSPGWTAAPMISSSSPSICRSWARLRQWCAARWRGQRHVHGQLKVDPRRAR
jgi:CheY-like chemotaxis protein